MSARPHLVWDWNGTLLDDVGLLVAAVNAALAAVGGAPVSVAEHRTRYRRPIRAYYEGRLGRALADDEFGVMCATFDDAYEAGVADCPLAPDAVACLDSWPGGQSLLSLAEHPHLIQEVTWRGLLGRFLLVEGRPVRSRAGKAELLARHLDTLRLAGSPVVLIGDSDDDHAAAQEAGVGCVLYAHGYIDRARLERTGAPVAETLAGAVALATAAGMTTSVREGKTQK
ncbi:HAD family hydrolase [Catellatospora sichuanensis]|uniref:HAD family hydrolase n=1 Tax=Catellatospora sichuanensis TaxID=1969805 RepID=UPI0011820F35|nr:HAD hydrolase-like protein [Catellatospora sichuanensis]